MLSPSNIKLFAAIKAFDESKSETTFAGLKKAAGAVHFDGEKKKNEFFEEINSYVPGAFVFNGKRWETKGFLPTWTVGQQLGRFGQLFSSDDWKFFGEKYAGQRLKICWTGEFNGSNICHWVGMYSKTICADLFRATAWADDDCTEAITLGPKQSTHRVKWLTFDVFGPSKKFTADAFRAWLETPTAAVHNTTSVKDVTICKYSPRQALFISLKKELTDAQFIMRLTDPAVVEEVAQAVVEAVAQEVAPAVVEAVAPAADLANAKQKLGERLFVAVKAINASSAPRIVGMLLELSNEKLEELLVPENDLRLRAKVAEAAELLAMSR